MSNDLEYFQTPTVRVSYVMCQPIISIILRFVYVSVPLTAIAKGYRDFGDCAVFTDGKRETYAEVTSSTNPLDFVLRANVSRCQNEARIRLVLKDGDCSDKNQVILQMIR